MKRYRVFAKVTSFPFIEVKTNNKEEAIEIAKYIDGGDFDPNETADTWEINNAIEIKEKKKRGRKKKRTNKFERRLI